MDAPEYEIRIRELQQNLTNLRLSRKVLMNLLVQMQDEQKQEQKRHDLEAKKLHRANANHAKLLMEKNRRIGELEKELQTYKRG